MPGVFTVMSDVLSVLNNRLSLGRRHVVVAELTSTDPPL